MRNVTSYKSKATAASTGSWATLGIGLAVGMMGGPIGAIIGALVAAIGCSITAANYMADCASSYVAVKDYYSIIKTYA
jgi:hypothetical protein